MFPVLVSPHTEARQYRVDPNLLIQKMNDCSYCAVTAVAAIEPYTFLIKAQIVLLKNPWDYNNSCLLLLYEELVYHSSKKDNNNEF